MVATMVVVFALTTAYGLVAIIGYMASFDKTTYHLMRSESNLYYSLAHWQDNQLQITLPTGLKINFPTLVYIYDVKGNLLWKQRNIPELEKRLDANKNKLGKSQIYDLNISKELSLEILKDNPSGHYLLEQYFDYDNVVTHSISISHYGATEKLPELSIVVVDVIPQELQFSETVRTWFNYVLLANVLLVLPLLWLAGRWSLRPIKQLTLQIQELESGKRELLDDKTPQELRGLVNNLNILLENERQRYRKYHTTLSDLTHSLKTPLAVMQSTLRSLRTDKSYSLDEAEPIMIEQINRISQQVGYYLNRAVIHSDQNILSKEVHSVFSLLESLCSALNKVYQRKGVSITLDIPPELTFVGDKNDFMEVLGNLLDNACKYCLEFVEVTARIQSYALIIDINDDGPGIPVDKREIIFQRGQRADTLQPGQGLGLSVALDILEQYQGNINVSDSELGGAHLEIKFGQKYLQQ